MIGKNCVYARHKFEIQVGRDTHLDVAIERGIPVTLEFVVQTKETIVEPRGRVTVEIKDSTGRLILTRAASRVRHDELLRVFEFAVRPGKYQVTATTETGNRAESALTVGDKPAEPKRIVLR